MGRFTAHHIFPFLIRTVKRNTTNGSLRFSLDPFFRFSRAVPMTQLQKISAKVEGVIEKLKAKGISVKYDDRDTQKPGWKFADYELKGVPVRLAIGERDLANGTIEVARRDTLTKETLPLEGIEEYVEKLLEEIQVPGNGKFPPAKPCRPASMLQ